jgi:hypothetical protein
MSQAELENALKAKLQELLERAPVVRALKILRQPGVSERAFDLQAAWPLPTGGRAELWVDCQADPRPSQFPYAAFQQGFDSNKKRAFIRVPVFAAPHISPRMAEVCWKHNWSWFDLAGNCRLCVPGALYIERTGLAPVHQRRRVAANLSTAEAGRIIRALLAPENAGSRWTQRELARHIGEKPPGVAVSLGLVNKVFRFLREEAFVVELEEGGVRLRDPVGLLFAWREAYRFDRHHRRDYFTLLRGRQLQEKLAELDSITGGQAAYAVFSAAEFQAPHVRQTKTWLYLAPEYETEFAALLEAKRVESGENLIVLLADDRGVFYSGEGAAGRLPCTNPVQTYVDLSHAGNRGAEAAAALLEQKLKPEWKLRGLLRAS